MSYKILNLYAGIGGNRRDVAQPGRSGNWKMFAGCGKGDGRIHGRSNIDI